MKEIIGKAQNIEKEIIGKITKKDSLIRFSKKLILVTSSPKKKYTKYQAIITIPTMINKIDGVVFYTEDIESLNEEDIVLIKPDGRISVLYQSNSYHNVLLLTNLCNCDCIMCPQPKVKRENDMTPLNIELISLMSKKTKQLGITGGEPTLLGDNFFRIISECKNKLPETSIEILSNGIKFKDFEFTKELALLDHPDLLVAISLYADTDNEHNNIIQTKGFYDTIEGFYNLALFQQKIEIRVVINALNYKRLLRLAEFIYHNFPFIYHIAMMGMEPTGLAEKNINKVWIDPYDYRNELRKAIIYLNQRDMNVSIYNHQLCILPKDLWFYSRKSISTWKNIYIDECTDCQLKDNCGGFFESSIKFHSNYIKPFNMIKA